MKQPDPMGFGPLGITQVRFEKVDDISQVAGLVTSRFRPGVGGRCVFLDLDLADEGVSENSVPLNPMVLLIIIPIKWLFHWEYTLFSDKPMSRILGGL